MARNLRLLFSILLCVGFIGSCKTRTSASSQASAPRPGESEDSLSADQYGSPLKNPTHFSGPFTTAGVYALNPDAIKNRYKGLDSKKYGTMLLLGPAGTPIKTPAGKDKYVRDFQYYIGNGKVGLRAFPVVEPSSMAAPAPTDPYINKELFDAKPTVEKALLKGKISLASVDSTGKIKVLKSTESITRTVEIDDYIINRLPNDKLTSFWDIFAVTTYTHPADYSGVVLRLPEMKLQGGYSHMGAYYGRGRTRNSPFGYENFKIWSGAANSEHSQYPVDLVEVRFKTGVSRRVTNINSRVMNTILNGNGQKEITVEFPYGGYEFDYLMLDSVANHLHFFAAWVDPEYPETFTFEGKSIKWADAVHQNPELQTYCAEHITASLNLGFNLPFNESSFRDAYGDTYGKKLFGLARERHKLIAGYYPEEQNFKPLYAVNGLTGDPRKLTQPNAGLVWPLQSTGDFIANLLEQYVAWPDAGAPVTALTLYGMQPETAKRLGVPLKEYFEAYAMKVILQTFVAEAMTKVSSDASLENYLTQTNATIDVLFGAAGISATDLKALIAQTLGAQKAQLEGQAKVATVEDAWEYYRKSVQPVIEESRKRDLNCVPGQKCVKWYSSPAITHRINVGIHEGNPALAIETMATLFDPADLVKLKGATETSELSYDLQTGNGSLKK